MGQLGPTHLYPTAVVFSLALCYVGFIVWKKLTPHQLPLPPGPKGLPFLGNALQINKTEPWVTYREWRKTYGTRLWAQVYGSVFHLRMLGEIVSCKLLGQTYIIINSERVVRALLDQRSNIYSDRPVIRTSTL